MNLDKIITNKMKGDNFDDQIEVYVNEAYAETYIKQIYENTNSSPVELTVDLPKKNGVQFIDFEVEIKDKKVKSKLISKEKAVEKYSDAMASGNTGIFSEYNKELDKYIIHLGNIEPNTKVYFKSHFLQSIISNDLNYLYRLIDQFPFPKYNNNIFQAGNNKQYKIKIYFQTSSPITILEQKIQGTNPIIRNRFNEDKTKYEIELLLKAENRQHSHSVFYASQSENDYSPILSFEFQIKDFKKPKLYKQYDPKNDETTYLLSYFKTIQDEDNNNNELTRNYPGLYYFVIDQSGSMAGYPISLVKKTLKVFMQSLSKDSYFQLIGFGSNYRPYGDKPLLYTKENVNRTIKDIENLEGNMGGTDLFQPLQFIYNNCKENEKLHLPQNIFILTDGYTDYKQKILNIIEKNNSKYQVYAYGIGNDFDQDFIRTAAECGFGSYEFINDISNLSVVINGQLSKCMRVYYDEVKFNVEKNNKEILYDFYRNEFILENQLVNYSFIMKGKNCGKIEIKNSYKENIREFNDTFIFEENKILNLKDGDILAKIAIHNLIQKGEGEFSEEEKITKIAKKYQVLCQYTSLYAEVENTQSIKEPIIQIDLTNTEKNSSLFSLNNNYNYLNTNQTGLFNSNINNNYNREPYNSPGLFGNYNNSPSLFGANSSNKGLFGNNSNAKTSTLFGNNNTSNNSGSIFGNNANNANTNALFGNNNNIISNNKGSLFGNNVNDTNTNTKALFGNNNISNNTGDLFGNNNINNNSNYILRPYNQNNNSSSLFGNTESSNNSNNNTYNNNFFENNNNHSLFTFNSNNNEYNNKIDFSSTSNTNINNEEAEKINDDILENIIMCLDIIEGSWEENQHTKYILEMKSDIYNQVKSLVNNDKIAVTFVILFYILNDRKEKIPEYSNIINKAKIFLANNNYSYELILSKIIIY